MKCAVNGCYSTNICKKVRFYTFPKDPILQKKWVAFCNKEKINTVNERICYKHFHPDDVQRNIQYEMGLSKINGFKLKPGTIPSIQSYSSDSGSDSDYGIAENPLSTMEAERRRNAIVSLQEKIRRMKKLVLKQKTENFMLKKDQDEKYRDMSAMQLELQKAEYETNNIEEKLHTIFTQRQVYKLKNGLKRQKWNEEEIAHSITLHATSSKAYRLLRKKNFPLPAIRTLRGWSDKVTITRGILEPVMKILAATTQMDDKQKICVLSFDEMKIRKTYCYDRCSDSTLAPADYVLVAMLRGLISKWMQPIFYDFDCKMSKHIFFNILNKIQECGFHVVAVVSNLEGRNQGLFSELKVHMEKPWFIHHNEQIFVFANVPHLFKQLRNHFLDDGFLINGLPVQKKIVVELLSATSSELSMTHKLSPKLLSVVGADRQKVQLATKLFSHTNAMVITRAAILGFLDGQNWIECSQLFEIANDWFDVMNVRVPRPKNRPQAYGLNLDVQNKILDEMTEMVSSMRIIGKNDLMPFQKGILLSTNALKMLFAELKNRYQFEYVLTNRLNQEVVENFFDIFRTKGGLHDPPDQQNFKNRLRSCILGYNEGVSSDNTEKLLTGSILKTVSTPPEIHHISEIHHTEEQELDDLANEGLETLANYICHKLYEKVPTSEILRHMQFMQNIFDEVNNDGLSISDEYIKTHCDLAENIDCDLEVKKLFFRAKMFFRIRKLNKDIIENSHSKKRKLS